MKGIDASYRYEGYNVYKTGDLSDKQEDVDFVILYNEINKAKDDSEGNDNGSV